MPHPTSPGLDVLLRVCQPLRTCSDGVHTASVPFRFYSARCLSRAITLGAAAPAPAQHAASPRQTCTPGPQIEQTGELRLHAGQGRHANRKRLSAPLTLLTTFSLSLSNCNPKFGSTQLHPRHSTPGGSEIQTRGEMQPAQLQDHVRSRLPPKDGLHVALLLGTGSRAERLQQEARVRIFMLSPFSGLSLTRSEWAVRDVPDA